MKAPKSAWIWFVFLPVLVGCRSYGPRFDAHQSEREAVSRAAAILGYTNLVNLNEGAFDSISSTNQIRPEWLVSPTNFFTLGPGDSVEVEILGEQTSRTTLVVGPDGRIYYSLLPGLFIWGLTLTETKDLLERELARYVRVKPEVAVTLKTVGSKHVWILGSVQTPGVYSLWTPLTMVEAISSAGGIVTLPGSSSGLPDLQNSFLLRRGEIVPVDFHRLLSRGDLSQNIYLQPDDFIYFRSSTARNVYVLGAVALPNIVPYADDLSLAGAIASAGGTVAYAQASQVALIRGSLASPKIAIVDYRAISKGAAPDVRLQQGDIVYVPFVPWRKLAQFAEGVLRQFAYTVASNEGYKAAGTFLAPGGVTGTAPAATQSTGPVLPPPK
jgi:protein involved in polysaccharide export with SLBB domain